MNNEQAVAEITALKSLLNDTDYQAIKHSEGELSDADFAPIRHRRAAWRARINELESVLQEATD